MQRSWKQRMTGLGRQAVNGLLLTWFVTFPIQIGKILAADQPTVMSQASEPAPAESALASEAAAADEPLPEPIAIQPSSGSEPSGSEPSGSEPSGSEPSGSEPAAESTSVEAADSTEASEQASATTEPPKASAPAAAAIQLAPPIKISPPEKISPAPEESVAEESKESPLKVSLSPHKSVDQDRPTDEDQGSDQATVSGDAAKAARDKSAGGVDATAQRATPLSPQILESAAPPVVLAPELLPDQARQAKSMATTEIKSASFQGLTPGESTRDEVLESIGEPSEVGQQDNEEVLFFTVGPFPEVKITLRDDIVESIVIQLAVPTPRLEVAKELNLKRFRPVPIHDDAGQMLGEVYPERGMMFAYDLDQPAGDIRIGQVAIEPISSDPFLLRAASEATDDYANCLSDLGLAQQLSPDNAQLYWIRAMVLGRCGRLDAACQAAERALALQPDHVDYRLTLIDLQRQKGQYEEALIATQKVLAAENLSPLGRAEAQLQWGRLLAVMPPRDHKAAMDKTVQAVKMAVTLTRNTPPDVGRKASELVIESQLTLAKILAYGPWKQKYEVAPQWLLSAEQSAKDLIRKHDGDRSILLNVYCTSLECLAVLDGQGSPDQMADAAIQLGRTLIQEAVDDDYRAELEWELGTALWQAARIELNHGRPERALRFADNADALLASSGQLRATAPQTDYHLGQLHYLIGSIYSLHKKDAATATHWYEKALPRMKRPVIGKLRDQQGALGEQFVSMGISYWEAGQKNKALSITEDGTRMIQEAVDRGTLEKRALAIPFENLVAMHQALGNSDQAEHVANRAAKVGVGSTSSESQRR